MKSRKATKDTHRQASPCYQTSIPGIEPDICIDQAKAKKMRPSIIKNHGKSTKGNYMTEYLRVFSETFNKKPRRQPGYNHLR